jgi:hypothetical protein
LHLSASFHLYLCVSNDCSFLLRISQRARSQWLAAT